MDLLDLQVATRLPHTVETSLNPLVTERQLESYEVKFFSLIRPGIEPQSTISVAN